MTQPKTIKEKANENSAEFSKHFSLREKAIEEGMGYLSDRGLNDANFNNFITQEEVKNALQEVVDTYADEVKKVIEEIEPSYILTDNKTNEDGYFIPLHKFEKAKERLGLK